nr:putative ribonuclease H-like domain-containing protein [Tanacetum cinerariifolium]
MFGQDKNANGKKMFTPISVDGSTYVNVGGLIPINAVTLPNADLPTDPPMPDLEDTLLVLPITRIYKDHPKEKIIGDALSAHQTRRMTKLLKNMIWIEEIRLLLAYASSMGFIVYQIDVKSAFLYGTIKEEVYVCQPPGFEDPHFPNKVEKALYGLRHAPRAWYETLSTYLLENGFRRRFIDKTLFIKKEKGDLLLVQVYVDDIIFESTKKSLCTEFKGLMHKKFQMSSMGELTFFLGL